MKSKTKIQIAITYFLLFANSIYFQTAVAQTLNGFDLKNSLIPQSEILQGGPPKDGIPAINNPLFVGATAQHGIADTDRILGIVINGVAKAYPISILNWHELVNDSIDSKQYIITYCPLCGTGMAFETSEKHGNFGISGLLFNSDVLFYDKNTESLWSQILATAVTGKLKGEKLTMLPLTHTTWKNWKESHINTVVLSSETGFSRDYRQNPYMGYTETKDTFFPISHQPPSKYHPKERVIGIEIDGVFKAFPVIELNKVQKSIFTTTLNTQTLTIQWSKEHQSAIVKTAEGKELAVFEGFWFAWYTFHPSTLLFSPPIND